MKLHLKLFIISLIAVATISCSSNDSPEEHKTSSSKNTVIVYMLGNNSLQSIIADNMTKMQNSWSKSFNGNCVVILDEPQNYGSTISNDSKLSLIEIQERSSKTVKTYTNKDALNPTDMYSMIEEAMSLYPADKYTLILWSHGMGWLPNHVYPRSILRNGADILFKAFGESGSKQMELSALANGIPNYAFETIIFDACFMGSIEVAYELKNKANYMIASPAEIYGEGFPYHITIPEIMQGKGANTIASSYVEYYRNHKYFQGATIGVIKMNELETLAQKTKNFFGKFNSAYPLINNTNQIQAFDSYYPHVFFDFKEVIQTLSETGYQTEAQDVIAQLNKTILFEDHTDSFSGRYEIRTNCGLTSYIPLSSNISSKLASTYQTLSWYSASGSKILFN